MDADAARRLGLEAALREALARQELSVHYQPQISLESGNMIGMEALLRWNKPQFGAISPLEFIPIAEETGLILPIGEWVLRTACQQTRQWLDLGLANLRVAVNLSTRQFRQTNLVGVVRQVLAESRLPAGALELEITESAFIDDIEEGHRPVPGAEGARHQTFARRFRDRLFLARLHLALSVRQDQDRPGLCP